MKNSPLFRATFLGVWYWSFIMETSAPLQRRIFATFFLLEPSNFGLKPLFFIEEKRRKISNLNLISIQFLSNFRWISIITSVRNLMQYGFTAIRAIVYSVNISTFLNKKIDCIRMSCKWNSSNFWISFIDWFDFIKIDWSYQNCLCQQHSPKQSGPIGLHRGYNFRFE